MTPRERIVAYALGGVVALLMLFGAFRVFKGGFDAKYTALEAANADLTQKKRENTRGKLARVMVARYQEKTLSDDIQQAHLEFQTWLEGKVKAAELDKARVNFTGMPRGKKEIKELTYLVSGVGDIKQITEFLHSVHSAETLHRVRQVDLNKTKEGLKMTARIDAISMPKISGDKVEIGKASEDKLAKSLDEYVEQIAQRNIFSPGNEPPRFRSLREQEVELGRRLDGQLRATDPDDDEVYFELVKTDDMPEWLTLSESGELGGRPKKLGKHTVKVVCIDRGIPSKRVEGEFTIAVVEPPPPREEAPREDLDESTLAVLTAIVQGTRDPKPQMCMYLRDKDESRYLVEGDRLRVGDWRGRVVQVSTERNTVVLERDDDEYELRLGDALSDAKKVRKRD